MMWLFFGVGPVPDDLLGHVGPAADLTWMIFLAFVVGYWLRGVLVRR